MKTGLKRILGGLRNRLGLEQIACDGRISLALARAAATAAARDLDPEVPRTWEFFGFSQHGEDGIVDYLCSKLLAPNLYFFEIGSADGIENCTAWLALGRGYGGVMVEGSSQLSEQCSKMLQGRVFNVLAINMMVNTENIGNLMKTCPYPDPDVFVIDIDSVDYYVLERVFELRYRPKLIVVEYNSAFGPDQAVTVPYQANFHRWQCHPSGLYYGVSIAAWKKLLGQQGYHFVTVESTGCNAFFIDPTAFPQGFSTRIKGVPYLENVGDANGATRPYRDSQGNFVVAKREWANQFEMIRSLPLVQV